MHAIASTSDHRRFDAWGLYLLTATLLVPVLVPQGPNQLSLLDGLNIVAMGIFFVASVHRRARIRFPFLMPIIVIFLGSLLSVTNARSIPLSLLTLTQDLYLYLWFVLLVNQLADRGPLRPIRTAWIWTAVIAAVLGIALILVQTHGSLAEMIGLHGPRATGTFTNPNYFADYLVLSLFIALSASEEVGGAFLGFSVLAILAGLIAAKSNGGMIALISGLAAWALARAYTKRVSPMAIAGTLALLVAIVAMAWSAVSEWGIGARTLSELRERSFLGRAAHSSESRVRIWSSLRETYERSPLGIGPGNSSAVTLSVEQRERPASQQSKEAHSDYLSYAIERGPVALIGLLLLIGQAFGRLTKFWRQIARSGLKPAWGGGFVAAMFAGLVASSIHSLVIEKLHFRHFWLYLAVLWVITENAALAAVSDEKGSTLEGAQHAPRFRSKTHSFEGVTTLRTGC